MTRLRISRFALLAAIGPSMVALALPDMFAGVALCLGASAACLLLFAAYARRTGSSIARVPLVWFAGAPLAVLAIVPLVWREDRMHAFMGSALEQGTSISYIAMAAVFAMGVASVPTIRTYVWDALEAVGGVLSVWIALVAVGAVPDTMFSDISYHVALVLGMAALLASVRLTEEGWRWLAHAFVLLSSLVAFAFVFLPAAAFALGAAALGTAIVSWRAHASSARGVVIPAIAVILIALFGVRAPIVTLSEVSPPYPSSAFIVGAAYDAELRTALLGVGPRSYPYVWDMYRPTEFNALAHWDSTPESASSGFLTLGAELGLFGICAFLLYLVLAWRGFWSGTLRARESHHDIEAFAAALYVIIAMVFFAVPNALVLVGVAALGMCASAGSWPFIVVRTSKWQARLLALTCLAVALAAAWGAYRMANGAALEARGLSLLERGNALEAAPVLARAFDAWPIARIAEETSRAYSTHVRTKLQVSGATSMQYDIDRAIQYTNEAMRLSPVRFSVLLADASLHEVLAEHGVTGAADRARQSLRTAAVHSKTRPEIPYLETRLALYEGDTATAKDRLEKALALKPDYAPALDMRTVLRGR